MKIGVVLSVFALCIAAAVIGHMALAKPPAHVLEGLDRSASVRRDCAGLRKAAQGLVTPQNGFEEGSTVALFAIGISSVNPEPERLFDQPIPIKPDQVFGRDADAFERERRGYFDGMQKACEAAQDSRDSPVLRLVTAGISQLRSRGCGPASLCTYILLSDLEDDSDPRFSKVIRRAALNPAIELPAELASSIDNTGVRLEFCGTSEVRVRRTGKHAAPDTLARLWLGLFTHPELISFRPFCGG